MRSFHVSQEFDLYQCDSCQHMFQLSRASPVEEWVLGSTGGGNTLLQVGPNGRTLQSHVAGALLSLNAQQTSSAAAFNTDRQSSAQYIIICKTMQRILARTATTRH